MSENTSGSTKKKLRNWLFWIVGIVGIAAAVYFLVPDNLTKPIFDRRGWISDAYFVDGPNGRVGLLALYHYSESTTSARQGSRTVRTAYSWMASVDLETGKRLARVEFKSREDFADPSPVRFLGHTDTFVWMISVGEGLHGRNPYTSKVVVSRDDLESANPDLEFPPFIESLQKDYGESSNYAFDQLSRGVIVEIAEGSIVLVDPETLVAGPVAIDRIEPRLGLRGGSISIRDTGSFSLVRQGFYHRSGAFNVRLNPAWAIHSGLFVIDEISDDYLRSRDPESLFITYAEDLSESPRRLFSKVREDGYPIWSVDLTYLVEIAGRIGSEIYSVAGGDLFQIDERSGEVQWAYLGNAGPGDTSGLPDSEPYLNAPAFVRPGVNLSLSSDEISLGDLVFSNYEELGLYYPATIVGSNNDQTYTVVYLDGEIEKVSIESLMVDDLDPGAIVEVNIDGTWLTATVIQRRHTALGIELGEDQQSWVSLVLVRRDPEWGVFREKSGDRTRGDISLVRYSSSNTYYFGEVVDGSTESGGTVMYLDGTWEMRDGDDIDDATLSRGEPVGWLSEGNQQSGRLRRIVGLAAEVEGSSGTPVWVSLSSLYTAM